jgi:hypothetical protein
MSLIDTAGRTGMLRAKRPLLDCYNWMDKLLFVLICRSNQSSHGTLDQATPYREYPGNTALNPDCLRIVHTDEGERAEENKKPCSAGRLP